MTFPPGSRGTMHRNLAVLVLALGTLTALAPTGLAQSDPAPIVTEVDPNPPGLDRGNEWVELVNPAPVEITLDGLYLTDYDACFAPGEGHVDSYRWPLDVTLAPHEHRALELPYHCLTLADAGDELALVDEDGRELQHVAYGDEGALDLPSPEDSLATCEQAAQLHHAWSVRSATRGASNPSCSTPGVVGSLLW